MSTFNWEDVSVVFNGYIITGLGESPCVTVAAEGERWENKVMTDGSVVSNKLLGRNAKVTVKTRWNSLSNVSLQTFCSDDVVAQLTIRLGDGTTYEGTNGRIQKEPDPELGSGHNDNEWVIHVDSLTRNYSRGESS